MNKQEIVLIGGGGHCKACIDVIEQENKYNISGIVDVREKKGESVLGYEVIADDSDLPALVNEYNNFLISIGQIESPALRIKLFNLIKGSGGGFPVIVSPLAYVSRHSFINEGTIIMHHALVNAKATIGMNCIINTKALIEHNADIENHCHISTGAIVNGGVRIGKQTFFGSGAVSSNNTIISPGSFIKANTFIKTPSASEIKDITDGV